MIGYISGKVQGIIGNKVIVKLTDGLGYLVYVNEAYRFMVNEYVELFILHIQREDSVDLYGFKDQKDREWVEKLLKVSGVGPKMAANIIYQMGWENLSESIKLMDSSTIQQVKGLGLKTVKKILLELKGSEVDITENTIKNAESKTISNFTETLSNLGYKRSQIVNVITRLKSDKLWDESNLMEMVKLGLKYMSKA
ncbi:MAG: Holliday junction branch migration protein RuvA [candidate division SR1 bacterium]|nr:Holliday junction branch migration protein RuvA [candidate division SR1 bacterium]